MRSLATNNMFERCFAIDEGRWWARVFFSDNILVDEAARLAARDAGIGL
jgi:hypothetical protein